jgi:hypothetical protein
MDSDRSFALLFSMLACGWGIFSLWRGIGGLDKREIEVSFRNRWSWGTTEIKFTGWRAIWVSSAFLIMGVGCLLTGFMGLFYTLTERPVAGVVMVPFFVTAVLTGLVITVLRYI